MGLFGRLFGTSKKDDDDDDDNSGIFDSLFGSPGSTTADEDMERGEYKEKDWYD